MDRNNERGIAMVVALFMVLITSVVGAALMTTSQTETLSTQNYRMMSQARYGAESGVHHAANFLLNSYVPPVTNAEIAPFDTTTSPVKWNNQPVVLSSTPSKASNYPVTATATAFANTAKGLFDVNDATVNYRAYATLRSMRRFDDAMTHQKVTLQTWEIRGEGTIGGVRTATVEVASTVERQSSPLYSYAAFATHNGCSALSFAGGARTDSYDSAAPLGADGKPVRDNSYGNVGTNGNLTEVGNPTIINGSLSTPRQGVGACSANNVTAFTGSFSGLSGGLNKLSQEIQYPTPIIPAANTTNQQIKKTGGCSGIPACSNSANGVTLNAAGGTVTLGNLDVNAQAQLHFTAGTYVINSMTMNGNSQIIIDSGPVIIQIAGVGVATPLTITGNGISNMTYNPLNLQIQYAGTGDIKLAGGDYSSAVIYAPNASGSFSGQADLFGAVVVKYLTETGGAEIHYDRQLANGGMTAGNFMMSTFSWKTY